MDETRDASGGLPYHSTALFGSWWIAIQISATGLLGWFVLENREIPVVGAKMGLPGQAHVLPLPHSVRSADVVV